MTYTTKEAIIEAAIILFNTQGYSGTSIRDIAKKAKVNVSNIAYYFENKRGLLEYCFTTYFEGYLNEIEKGFNGVRGGAVNRLKQVTENILQFQSSHIQLTRLVLRETTIDSQIVRELMSTYFVKEKYYFKQIFEEGIQTREFQSFSMSYALIQYKGLLSMPFLNSDYLAEVLQVLPNEPYFVKKYMREMNAWIERVLCNQQNEKLQRLVP